MFQYRSREEQRLFVLNRLNEDLKKYENSNIGIYGTGGHTQLLLEKVNFTPVNIIGLIDKDLDKIGSVIGKHQVFSLQNIQDKIDIVIISSDIFQEVIYERIKFLEEMGIKVIKIYPPEFNDNYYIKSHERLYFHNDDILGTRKYEYLDIGVSTHINRYLWALLSVNQKNVLDVACGCGYGTSLLAEKAASVIGVDLDPVTIKYANKYFNAPNIKYLCSNLVNFDTKNKFDVITSFETIEHIKEEKAYLNKIKELLREDGIFIVSTPVAPNNGQSKINKWHINEFTETRFTEVLEEHFSSVRIFAQDIYNYGSIVFREAIPGNLEPYRFCLVAYCRK